MKATVLFFVCLTVGNFAFGQGKASNPPENEARKTVFPDTDECLKLT